MNRPTVRVFLALSLDGFIAGPDGDLDWLSPFSSDSPAVTGYERLMAQSDTLVLGRRTHDKLLSFNTWPYQGKRVVVLSHRPFTAHHGEQGQQGPLREVLNTLWAQGSRHVYLDGGDVTRQALQAGLVDDMTLFWVPVTLGTGVPLLRGLPEGLRLTPVETQQLPSGLVKVIYRPVHDQTEAPQATT